EHTHTLLHSPSTCPTRPTRSTCSTRPLPSAVERKDHHHRITGMLLHPHARGSPGCHGDVLPAADLGGDDAAANWTAGVETILHGAACGIERNEVARQLAGKDQAPSR